MILRILIRDFMRGYSDKDIASAKSAIIDGAVQTFGVIILTRQELNAVLKEDLMRELIDEKGLIVKC